MCGLNFVILKDILCGYFMQQPKLKKLKGSPEPDKFPSCLFPQKPTCTHFAVPLAPFISKETKGYALDKVKY